MGAREQHTALLRKKDNEGELELYRDMRGNGQKKKRGSRKETEEWDNLCTDRKGKEGGGNHGTKNMGAKTKQLGKICSSNSSKRKE